MGNLDGLISSLADTSDHTGVCVCVGGGNLPAL